MHAPHGADPALIPHAWTSASAPTVPASPVLSSYTRIPSTASHATAATAITPMTVHAPLPAKAIEAQRSTPSPTGLSRVNERPAGRWTPGRASADASPVHTEAIDYAYDGQ